MSGVRAASATGAGASAGPAAAAVRRSPQLHRIARLLGVPVTEVQGLDDVDDDALRELHEQMTRALYARSQAAFARVAALSTTVPGPVAGKLAERFLPPVLAARISELLEPDRARDLVGRVSITYLADIAVALDPVTARPVVRSIPPTRIGEVATLLFSRGEHAAMAEFASAVSPEALVAVLAVAGPADLAAIAPLLAWDDTSEGALDAALADLSDERVDAIVAELTPAQLAGLAVDLEPGRLTAIVERLDVGLVDAIARELFAREEHATLGAFAGLISAPMLDAVLAAASDDELAAVAPHLALSPVVTAAIADLPDERRLRLRERLPADVVARLEP